MQLLAQLKRVDSSDPDGDFWRRSCRLGDENASHRGHVAVVATYCDRHVPLAGLALVGWIEAEPAAICGPNFHPGVAVAFRLGLGDDVTADVPRRPAQMPGKGDQHVSKVLADTDP